MKKILILLSLVSLLAVSAFAQKQKNESETVDAANTGKQKNVSSKNKKANIDSTLQTGTSLEAQLQKTLDVKNAKIGDEVVLKVTKDIKQNGEVVVPKGAKLIGRVTEVQQKTKQNQRSKLGMVFERIEGKNLDAPINATIVSITNAASSARVGDVFSSDTSANSSSAGTVSRNNSGGGLLGGVTNTVGGVVNTTTNTVGGVTNTAGQTLGGATQTVGNTVNGIGISQVTSASANNTTMLSAENKNLKIEKGANFQLMVNNSIEK